MIFILFCLVQSVIYCLFILFLEWIHCFYRRSLHAVGFRRLDVTKQGKPLTQLQNGDGTIGWSDFFHLNVVTGMCQLMDPATTTAPMQNDCETEWVYFSHYLTPVCTLSTLLMRLKWCQYVTEVLCHSSWNDLKMLYMWNKTVNHYLWWLVYLYNCTNGLLCIILNMVLLKCQQ